MNPLVFLRALFPHTVKTCVRCGKPAGYWVYPSRFAMSNKAGGRPWCRSCIMESFDTAEAVHHFERFDP